ncbi:lymphokine-activated killer T-cell-originated protein kinase [Phymastichus coffea]|uniref:lymphokine-activated killer T-cell-originated protein kinase n=1 Tax=Phymastichus coffea TaxID=108790 RepID=UPI00273C8FA8|nr:lymphokine-activated killer T-cell-originated protein kinase [Phymastichus coffea]
MTEFKTPVSKRTRNKLAGNPEFQTPIKIPASPFLQQIGYGCGVNVFTFQRSPKVGFTRSPWAIKKRNKNVMKDSKYNARIQLEADILRKLSHPNIVGFRALTYSSDGEPCLAMEKLEISLGDLIEEKLEAGEVEFPANIILKIGFEIAKGLEYLHHTAYVLHGDIKSYNILTTKDYKTVKICDFGVSIPLTKALEMDTSTGEFMYIGTQCWSAPEIINENGPVTNKADIWAFGLVLWEMIALSPPHIENEDESMNLDTDDSMLECAVLNQSKENDDPNSDMEDDFLQNLKDPDTSNYGTRPPLPAIQLGKEYDKVLELFYACTDEDYKTRPSAKGVVMFFKNFVKITSDETSKV